MLIPEYWAEARIVAPIDGRDRVVRRWGWSMTSQAEAEAHAQTRAREDMAARIAGVPVQSVEWPGFPYGRDGVPIREEAIARGTLGIVTRNSYGALCLNIENAMFADIDFVRKDYGGFGCCLGCLAVPVGLAAIIALRSHPWIAGIVLSVFFAACAVQRVLTHRAKAARIEDWRTVAIERLRECVAPGERYRVYETPNGYRLLAMHAAFEPSSEATAEVMDRFDVDGLYVNLCKVQQCFRARLTPKPWRVGLDAPRFLRRLWPVPVELRPLRNQWIASYEAASRGYAACRYVMELGDGSVEPYCSEVQELHDELSGALSGLPIA